MEELMTTNILESGYLPIFSWSKHIAEVCHKARQKVGILYRKSYKNANKDMMLKLYLSCIRPDLEYAAPVWSPHLKGQMEDVESVQKLTLSVCCKTWDIAFREQHLVVHIPTLATYPECEFLDRFYIFNLAL